MAAREFDIVLYGATGFTGGLATEYLAKSYGTTLKWAIAGRSRDKLEAVKAKEGAGIPEIIVADSSDKASLLAMAEATSVVATTAGPFARYGTLLVEACAETGTDYCDITGETPWVRDMIAQYDEKARGSGARIVSLCGHDSVPWDLSTYYLAKKLKEDHGTDLARVDFYDDIKSAPSGGTLETAFGIMFGKESKAKKSDAQKALGYDPLLKLADGGASDYSVTVRNVGSLQRSSNQHPHRTLFFMAGVNAYSVKRSNALNKYGKKVTYCEGERAGSLIGGIFTLIIWIIYGLFIYIPPLRWLMRKFVLPKPGQGPSKASMEAGHLHVLGVAIGEDKSVVSSTMSFFVDPGYLDTARMLVESALALSLDMTEKGGAKSSPGGVFTPGACQKEALFDRLIKTGTQFKYHD